ncbi:MAG: 2-amino-4-hydroxy-6-hydroxymethyldihydropteridine diphosphokinase [Betaproteobacteria bacterium]|nr:2-amino-4-hydroxy-6-hydroxymethyldihydropteridine diphosphokinase [Betaproteobacteria bacterium]NBT10114.1 2-amino-4-hydroxy-6-hydroxymethyldihydropteridine diphosphokinase [Betaproteobacteria bacterium]NBU48966.1 2-amino-4-hydroxy-6-hydroxymethyldihydropteridine diphosphokinase [Betaproteobacteria bacterium]NBX96317.1 2-amino-4-hydroxy-6-hydroxymethyldihydropteridine diphosphokinase [Betaproteobacteria bacterium]
MVAPSELIVVGLGSNLGDTHAHLRAALEGLRRLDKSLRLRLRSVSPLYRTVPWQAQGPDFINAVVVLEGTGDERAPSALLHELQAIEASRDRARPYRYAPRSLDLDLILFGLRVRDTPELQLPHPRALERAFVLQPLQDVLPNLNWPGLGLKWRDRLQALSDPPPQRLQDPEWPALELLE